MDRALLWIERLVETPHSLERAESVEAKTADVVRPVMAQLVQEVVVAARFGALEEAPPEDVDHIAVVE
jgi:hypothetical protein